METKRNNVAMGQAEYNAFRKRMKQWMLENADVYDDFEEIIIEL